MITTITALPCTVPRLGVALPPDPRVRLRPWVKVGAVVLLICLVIQVFLPALPGIGGWPPASR